MFAESLLESAPHIGHRTAWTKFASVLLQSAALAIALAIPLFHVEHLQFMPTPPSIQMTSVRQLATVPQQAAPSTTTAVPSIMRQIVEPRWIPQHVAQEHGVVASDPEAQSGPPCGANCANGLPVEGFLSPGLPMIKLAPPRPPERPLRISEMQLGTLVRRVVPEYPIIAKQLRVEGAVVLMATIAKDGRVEHVQPLTGPPLLIPAALRAVEQWQYRPYLLNQEPIVVQTQITVNFVLNRN